MKKKLMVVGLCGVVCLLLGAVAVETVDRVLITPKTVKSFSDIYEYYLTTRESLPPLPLPSADVMQRMAKGDFSFLKKDWEFRFSGGTLYLAEDSKLSKKLKLPLRLMIYEDLQRGEIVILSSADGERYKGEVLFDAPEFFFVDENSSLVGITEKRASEEKAIDFFWDIGPRRVVLNVILKSESEAWNNLVSKTRSTPAPTATVAEDDGPGGMMMMGGPPPEFTNNLWLGIDQKKVTVYVPENFTNRVELYSTEDLVSDVWNIAVQNLTPVSTNPVDWTSSLSGTNRFFICGNQDIDDDEDGLPNARESIVHKTDPNDADTDGDQMPDGWEIQYGFNPLLYSDGAGDFDGDDLSNADEYLKGTYPDDTDSEDDGMPDGWEVNGGLDPLSDDSTGDPDGDGVSNLAEYMGETHPQIVNVSPPGGAQGRAVFRYDDDGRLTEAHLNNTSAELAGLTPAHNVSGLNVFTMNGQ